MGRGVGVGGGGCSLLMCCHKQQRLQGLINDDTLRRPRESKVAGTQGYVQKVV